MLDCGLYHRQPINLFLRSADELYGPITTICIKGQPPKWITWASFEFLDVDWQRVKDAQDILQVHYYAI